VDLATAAHRLYEVRPEEFMAARGRLTAEARAAGDAGLAGRIGRLRRPTVSAWAVNRLSRVAGDELAELLELGAELRAAWSSGGSIGELEQRRGEVVASLLRAAERLAADAGRPLREAALREVEDTLQAAAVDPDVAGEVRAGTLDRPRSHTGFEPAAFAARPAPPGRAEAPSRRPSKSPKVSGKQRMEQERRRRAEAARAAERRAEEAAKAQAEWESEVTAAQRELDERTAETGELRRRLDAALDRQKAAERRVHVAHRELTRASRLADDARRRAGETARTARR
jgi:hypothetical protein